MEIVEQLIDYLGRLTEQYGALGIAVSMFAESAGVPFASTVVLLTSGSMIFSGKVSFWSVFMASTLGITLGSIFSYYIGFFSCWAGKFVKTSFFNGSGQHKKGVKSVHRSKTYRLWERYGSFSIFMAQLWGVTRTFISFPAGAMHMNMPVFIVYTTLGGAIFSLLAIVFSMALTGTMGLLFRYTRYLMDLSPWVWASVSGAVVLIIYMGWRKGWFPLFLRRIESMAQKFRNKR